MCGWELNLYIRGFKLDVVKQFVYFAGIWVVICYEYFLLIS